MRSKKAHIGLYLLFFTFYWAAAQPKAVPDRSAIRIGEPVHVQLSSVAATANDGFVFPDSIPHFDIWDRGQPQKSGDTLLQNITITSYDSGRFSFPELQLVGASPKVHTNGFSIDVQPVNIDSLKDYHDIKDIIGVPPIPQWPYVVCIGLAAILSIVALYYLFQKINFVQEAEAVPFTPRGNPLERAIQLLEKLKESLANGNVQPSPFFTQLTGIYRNYLAETRNWRSLQQTGDELILQAKPILNHELFYQFANAIRLADAAKFAKYNPPKEEWKKAVDTMADAIRNLDVQRWGKQVK